MTATKAKVPIGVDMATYEGVTTYGVDVNVYTPKEKGSRYLEFERHLTYHEFREAMQFCFKQITFTAHDGDVVPLSEVFYWNAFWVEQNRMPKEELMRREMPEIREAGCFASVGANEGYHVTLVAYVQRDCMSRPELMTLMDAKILGYSWDEVVKLAGIIGKLLNE